MHFGLIQLAPIGLRSGNNRMGIRVLSGNPKIRILCVGEMIRVTFMTVGCAFLAAQVRPGCFLPHARLCNTRVKGQNDIEIGSYRAEGLVLELMKPVEETFPACKARNL